MSRVTLFHPEFGTPGGAEILVASHAQFLRDAGRETHVATFRYDPVRWSSWFGGVGVDAMPPDRGRDKVRDFFLTKPTRLAAWASTAFPSGSTVIAYNHPASSALGHSRADVRRIWHCCEPPRDLHMFEANPILAARMRATLGLAKEDATRRFYKESLAWRFEQRFGLSAPRQRRRDLSGIAPYQEIWALSEFSRDNVARIYGRRDAEVIYPLVRFPSAPAQKQGLARGGLSILCQTRLETQKNVDTVIRGFARFLRAREGAGARLHVVGQGVARARLETIAETLGIGAAVTFHGFASDAELERIYAACDVFALLPIDEPFGMVFPEAMARGLLVVGPDHGGPREILDGGASGFAVDAFDPEKLAETFRAITRLDDAEVDRRRARADRDARARFGREAIGARLLDLLG